MHEAVDWLPEFTRRFADGMRDLFDDISGQRSQLALDFLYDFSHQGHYLVDGALSSPAASQAVAASQSLAAVREWLTGKK